MSIPLQQKFHVGRYIVQQKIRGNRRYPLVLMLEPLFRCNLACSGCGKIDYPDEILNQRLSVEDSLAAVDECGAPIVSIAGGEPLIHKDMAQIVEGIVARKKYIYLCTNALLLKKKMHEYQPTPFLTFSVHLDGLRARHDASVGQEGVFDQAIDAISTAIAKGFRVTVNCTFFQGESADEAADFFDAMMALGVEGMTVSPGFSYEHAPAQDVFLQRTVTKQLFRDIFNLQKQRKKQGIHWAFNQSSMFLDFLAGNQSYHCTAWGNPTRNVFGWQKPCYLLVDEGYTDSFQSLMDDTDWDRYGTGRNPKCANCMAHCGYEPTAVCDTSEHPLKALRVALFGPRTDGPMAAELPVLYQEERYKDRRTIPIRVDHRVKTD